MSEKVTVVHYDDIDENLSNTILSIKPGEITSNNYTNYENGTINCPNGKKMIVETIDISENLLGTINNRFFGNTEDVPYTVEDLKNSVSEVGDFDNYTLLSCDTDTEIISNETDSLLFKVEEYKGIGNSSWNPNIVLRLVNYNNIKTPPIDIEIYNEGETLIYSTHFISDWSGTSTTGLQHQVIFIKIIYPTETKNTFKLRVE